MGKTCLKCGYVRGAAESVPEYECPGCGAIYAKVEAAANLKARREQQKLTQEKPRPARTFSDKEMVCPHCGYLGVVKRQPKGSFWIELVLWLAFLLPGLIYSIWRLTNTHTICPSCGSDGMVPALSPRGKKLIEEHGHGND